jgi:hypothetical protein
MPSLQQVYEYIKDNHAGEQVRSLDLQKVYDQNVSSHLHHLARRGYLTSIGEGMERLYSLSPNTVEAQAKKPRKVKKSAKKDPHLVDVLMTIRFDKNQSVTLTYEQAQEVWSYLNKIFGSR